MNYLITGSVGHISKPIIVKLLDAGHSVTVITTNADKAKEIESIGAKTALGSVEDAAFLTKAFAGAEVVYLMIPPNFGAADILAYQKKVGDNYLQAIKANTITKAVVLSSVGAHMRKGAGLVDGAAYLEEKLNAESAIHAVYLRPSYFYYNLFNMIPLIKHAGIIGSTQSSDHTLILTHTNDIAEAAAEELLKGAFDGKHVRYIASDERSWSEITKVLSEAIGKPGIPYVEFSDEQSAQGMLQAGLSKTMTDGFVEMGKALREGTMEADYWKNKPAKMGDTKLETFAGEFAAVYKAS